MREQETATITSIKSEIRWKEWEDQIRDQTSSGLTAKDLQIKVKSGNDEFTNNSQV